MAYVVATLILDAFPFVAFADADLFFFGLVFQVQSGLHPHIGELPGQNAPHGGVQPTDSVTADVVLALCGMR